LLLASSFLNAESDISDLLGAIPFAVVIEPAPLGLVLCPEGPVGLALFAPELLDPVFAAAGGRCAVEAPD